MSEACSHRKTTLGHAQAPASVLPGKLTADAFDARALPLLASGPAAVFILRSVRRVAHNIQATALRLDVGR